MKKMLCLIGLHDWEITKWSRFRSKKHKDPFEQGFDRCCEWCDKEQRLERPKEYHPTAYVWTDLTPKN